MKRAAGLLPCPCRRVPFEAPPGLLASHHAWLCRQHMVMAELLLSSGEALQGLKVRCAPGACEAWHVWAAAAD